MKKHFFLTFVLVALMCICSIGIVGCGEKNYTKDDIDSLYTSIKTDSKTSQFFSGEFLKVDFDTAKVDVNNENDKSYIFSEVYSYYLKSSSGLLSGVVDRVGKISYIVKNFSQEQRNDIYNKLANLKSSLNSLANTKTIYETSNGNLHYKNMINAYNNVISKCYALNNAFSNYYFVPNLGQVNFESAELTDSNVRDMLRYQLLKISKVSFNYELLNFVFSNPLGEIKTWYNSTSILKSYVSLTKNTLTKLNNVENLANHIGGNSANVLALFTSMQKQEKEYNQEYCSFIESVNSFNLKSYFVATNKTAYLENCSNNEQSYFKVIQNFLAGRYSAFTTGLANALSYM